ncbi:MAG: lytic transglycosylase domain-containing protein [Mycobacteriales bacterium]|nr:lytic transglycosylase domain-containing protein [Mycobacteriales bacterium]
MRARVVALGLALTACGGVVTATRGLPVTTVPSSLAVQPPMEVAAEAQVAPSAVPLAPSVAPLRTLRTPDLVVTVVRPLTAAQAARLRAITGVRGLTVADIGTVQLAGRGARVLGVDPSQLRQFTPRETATSDPLWQAVARGEVVASYSALRARGLSLGGEVGLAGRTTVRERIGGVAALGLPGVDLVTDRRSTRALGVVRDSAVVLDAPSRRVTGLVRDVRRVVGADARVDVLRPEPVRASRSRPSSYRELYQRSAALCPGLPWQVLSAVGEVESGHGRNNGPSSAGALGPMQFLPATWAAYGVDGDGDRRADVMSPYDAVPAAALYLCRNGGGQGPDGLYDALFAYNHADWYVRKVLATAERY